MTYIMDLAHEASERRCWVEVPDLEQYKLIVCYNSPTIDNIRL